MPGTTDPLDAVFAALADPTRRAVLLRLRHGEATVGELAAPHAMTPQAVSQHIRVLEQAGLVSRGRVRQTRPVRLETAALDRAQEWWTTIRAAGPTVGPDRTEPALLTLPD